MNKNKITKNEHILTNETLSIRQSSFVCMCLFMHVLTTDVVSVVFNILSLHTNTNLRKRYFLHSHFLISKDSPILYALSN